jgi:hypothetical protein
MNLSALPSITNNIPINAVGIAHKWNDGVINRNWLREFHWLNPEYENGIFELRRVGVPPDTLLRAGYEIDELLNAGYTENDLQKAIAKNQKK